MKIKYNNIGKSYIKNEWAVRSVNFTVESGEFVVLLGPSGCGKTTVLRMTAGLEQISEGEIQFNDKVINDLPPSKRNVGMVFQNYALYPHLNVFENLAFPMQVNKMPKTAIKKRVGEIAELIGLHDYLHRKPKELSGGQRQRVALGRAIVRKPDVFLFDEPLSNLDAKLRMQMRTEIINLQKTLGCTAIYVTHDQIEAMTMAQKVVVFNNGEIMQIGTPDEIYNKPSNLFVASFIGNPQMNFFNGTIFQDSGLYFIENNTGNKIHLNEDIIINQDLLNKEIVIGIRAENIYPKNVNDSPNSITSEILNIENLGYEEIIVFSTNDQLKYVRNTDIGKFSIGNTIHFCLNSDKILIFE